MQIYQMTEAVERVEGERRRENGLAQEGQDGRGGRGDPDHRRRAERRQRVPNRRTVDAYEYQLMSGTIWDRRNGTATSEHTHRPPGQRP